MCLCVCVLVYGFFGRLLVQAKVDTVSLLILLHFMSFHYIGSAECIVIFAQVSKIHVGIFLSKLRI